MPAVTVSLIGGGDGDAKPAVLQLNDLKIYYARFVVTVQTPPTIFSSEKEQSMCYAAGWGTIQVVSERLRFVIVSHLIVKERNP